MEYLSLDEIRSRSTEFEQQIQELLSTRALVGKPGAKQLSALVGHRRGVVFVPLPGDEHAAVRIEEGAGRVARVRELAAASSVIGAPSMANEGKSLAAAPSPAAF